ncbi:hypothetical protein HELRODRAFT_183699 [Helobdella robusta]|uniref:Uncharacterized protein n=1 Tax=Helobdella robusta TaxID=6412 RepID=T1FK25_HELRO|nr:hypothetical protein HELRODRAFT_183699 [Helobdella robusta]ESO10375.1 hypothetical protein HELRODRAFT_183699 [Helobdella robusta]
MRRKQAFRPFAKIVFVSFCAKLLNSSQQQKYGSRKDVTKRCECGFVARRPRHLLRHKKYNCMGKEVNNVDKPAQDKSAEPSVKEQKVVTRLNNEAAEEFITLEMDESDIQALLHEFGDIPNLEFKFL